MTNYPNDWTALCFWLQIYSNEELEQVVAFFNGNGYFAKRQQLVTTPQQRTGKDEMVTADDDWDKEHIDEIQGKSCNRGITK